MTIVAGLAAALTVYLALGLMLGAEPARLHRGGRRRVRPGLWLRQAGVPVPPLAWIGLSVLLAAATAYVGYLVTASPAVGGAVGIMAGGLPTWRAARRRVRRIGEASRAWPDALRFLAASVRSGRTLPGALADLAAEGPPPLARPFARFETLAAALGPRAALEIVREDLADPRTDRVIELLTTALERGGMLVPELLREMAESTAEDIRTEEEIVTASLELRLNARIVTVLPWVVLVALTARPGPFREFYATAAGTTVIVLAGVLTAVGFMLLTWFGRVAVEPRLLIEERTR